MSTWGEYTFEFDETILSKTNALVRAGVWDETKEEIKRDTNLSGVFSDLVRGYMNDYDFKVESFNDDVQIAIEIIEKNYLQTFGGAL